MVLADPFADLNDPKQRRVRQFAIRYRWWLVAAVLVLAVVVAATVFVRWLGDDRALETSSGRNGVGLPVKVGRTYYTPPMVFSASKDDVTVDVRSVVPRLTADSADARFTPLVCKRNNREQELGGPDLSSYAWCHPFTPGVVSIGPDADAGQVTIILAVTARHAGALDFAGVHVDYRQGIRRGTANSGLDVQMWTGRTDPFWEH